MSHDLTRPEEAARAWRPLTYYRWMTLVGFLSFFLQPLFHTGDIKTGLLVLSGLVFAIGVTQTLTFVCPVCEGRFSHAGFGRLMVLGWAMVTAVESSRLECRSCGARIGEGVSEA